MSELWAITCFFNPAGYKRRVQNYRWFRKKLNAPLITVELSFHGRFALQPGDADILVQLDQGDILFQKERLLNVALSRVPPEAKAVAWIDCDVAFASSDWAERTLEALERQAIVQLFRDRFDLPPDVGPEAMESWDKPRNWPSLMAMIAEQKMTLSDFQEPMLRGRAAWGLAWAARKDLLERHGLYDACILTSGDGAIFSAGFGVVDTPFSRWRMNDASFRHYLEWARPFTAAVAGRIGHIEGGIFHFWHGGRKERRYGACLAELAALGFNPYTDIARTCQDTWKWSSHKPRLHAHVKDYFWARNEDGVSAADPA